MAIGENVFMAYRSLDFLDFLVKKNMGKRGLIQVAVSDFWVLTSSHFG